MTEKLGIKETQEAVDAALDVANMGIQIGAVGVGIQDIAVVLAALPQLAIDVPKAIEGAGNIPGELGDLSTEEAGALIAHVIEKLGVGDAHAKLIVEKALRAAAADYDLVKAIVQKPVG